VPPPPPAACVVAADGRNEININLTIKHISTLIVNGSWAAVGDTVPAGGGKIYTVNALHRRVRIHVQIHCSGGPLMRLNGQRMCHRWKAEIICLSPSSFYFSHYHHFFD